MKLAEVRRFALKLPEVTEEPHHHYSSFRVRGKIFVTVPPDSDYIHVFVNEIAREQALVLHPGFVDKLVWGGKVRGVRVQLSAALPDVVKNLLRSAWTNKAPRALVDVPDRKG